MKAFFPWMMTVLIGTQAFSMPAQVLIIRHAEKSESHEHLNDRGRARAQKLAQFFSTDPLINQFGKIAAAYAMKPPRNGGSLRPIETILPTVDALNIPLNAEFKNKDVEKVAESILNHPQFNGRTVLICWDRKYIPELAQALGLRDGPQKWDGKLIFDRVWMLKFTSSTTIEFENRAQHLFDDDSTY